MSDQTPELTGSPAGRQIGPIGTGARLCVGAGLLIAGLASEPTATELAAGFVVLPVAELVVMWLLRPPRSDSIHVYGPLGYAFNFGIGAALLIFWTTPALLFYGASVLLAVVLGYAGCEILALSNFVRRRDDQLACAVFSPIDGLEASR